MLLDDYAAVLTATIERIRSTQRDKILLAAGFVKNVIQNDGLIYVFGCGHSHMLAEETFYRAGGLACVAPVFNEPLMLHQSASESSRLEKKDGYYRNISQAENLTGKDMLICVSSSGINAVPVEFPLQFGNGVFLSSALHRIIIFLRLLIMLLANICRMCAMCVLTMLCLTEMPAFSRKAFR